MKKCLFYKSGLFLFCAIISFHAFCNHSAAQKEKVADCLPPTSYTYLDIGNVRARIIAGGDMWWDLAGDSYYEVPKGSQKHSMFSAALWIGGVDDHGQLRLAAQRYRQVGIDFWAGPLTTDGNATIDRETCSEYDKLFVVYKQDVVDFVAWFKNPSLYPDYSIPQYFFTYPAHGDVNKGQARYLAPFFDYDGDASYNPLKGDYPLYDLDNSLCCPLYLPPGISRKPTMGSNPLYGTPTETGGSLYDQSLKGDQTIWWVFNDKGNNHTETGGAPLGIEVRAQAFAYKKPQDLLYSTFYGYEIINRSNQDLNEVYVGIFADVNVGYAFDDYIRSDVYRGLGYAYNGKEIDGTGNYDHYGANPPAVGIDFFLGPYMDPDGLDNPRYFLVWDSLSDTYVNEQICDESISGQNFGNGIIDDERMGMQKFIFFISTGGVWVQGPPSIVQDYYNYLRGIWKDGTSMMYGGNAHANSGAYGPACSFMFPGDSDPCNWGTAGIAPYGPTYWTEETCGNVPYDRRFLTTSGPFTLEAGGVNYVTWGVPWARATCGGPLASVEQLKYVDDKIQRLFDNCFRIVQGPDAPDIIGKEMDREIILYLSNKPSSNNYIEQYIEFDHSIVPREGLATDSVYRFEGYMVYQVKNPDVKFDELNNPDKARLVAQCDVKNGIDRIINFYYDTEMNSHYGVEEVNGADNGIAHSFRIVDDAFATGNDKRLVNNKKYYFTAIAYAHNEFEKFTDDPFIQFPGLMSYYGQKICFVSSARNMKVVTLIPHIPSPLSGGTVQNSVYGTQPSITRIEGHGNGGLVLELNHESFQTILDSGRCEKITWLQNHGPVNVKVIDPLGLKPVSCKLFMVEATYGLYPDYSWILEVTDTNGLKNQITSHYPISYNNEQIILELGISIELIKSTCPGDLTHPTNGFLKADITYADSSQRWLSGVANDDAHPHFNWIRSGTIKDPYDNIYGDYVEVAGNFIDPDEHYENILGGTWAPYRLVSRIQKSGPAWANQVSQNLSGMEYLYSVDIVFTPDKSKWSRCPVVEACGDKALAVDNVEKHHIRKAPSVDKNGNPDGTGTGMGWFPGYVINVETGERLNLMFAENSWLAGENGNDMIFNPTWRMETSMGEPLMGGMHFLYIFGSRQNLPDDDLSPAYDEGIWAKSKLDGGDNVSMRRLYQSIMWVSVPTLAQGKMWLQNEVRIRIRVSRPYMRYLTASKDEVLNAENENYPVFEFNTFGLVALNHHSNTAQSALDLINIVPNPYYAYSDYEGSQTEMLVKITNLPDVCTVSIFTASGSLVRQFQKNDNFPIIEWDLKNQAGDVIAGGIYLIHVHVPGVGERTLKWFGSMRNSTQSF